MENQHTCHIPCISRRTYADMHGPTTGNWVRLGNTGLLIEI
ncbi:hypothetical protein [Hymenobacter daecheongensis]|nr:hypothetical protein [Hymenobacter daecheongensis]